MSVAEITAALDDARLEGRGWWRCRCPVQGGVSQNRVGLVDARKHWQ
jgi:hypothetical protein